MATTPMKLIRPDAADDASTERSGQTSGQDDLAQRIHQTFAYHLQLRIMQNRILDQLYAASQAYVHPSRIGLTVSDTSRKLEAWYRSLPLSMQFSRRVLGHTRMGWSQDSASHELSQRYFACQFLLNRPVFYFVLHEDMEQAASPPEVMANHQGIQPWMQDACHASVQNAINILASRIATRRYNNWCDNQLLLAAHLMTMQAQMKPETSGLSHEIGDMESLLDMAERALDIHPARTLVDLRSVEILRNVRQNVRNTIQSQSSPP